MSVDLNPAGQNNLVYINGIATGYGQRNGESYIAHSGMTIFLKKGESIYFSGTIRQSYLGVFYPV